MSTHNIGFYEEIEKLSLNYLIKYAPYLFLCVGPQIEEYQALMGLNCKRRMLLSGTPIQNDLESVSIVGSQIEEL